MKRRSFISNTVIGGLGLSVAPSLLSFSKNAGDKIVVALIGCGGRGISDLNGIISENANVEVKYLCDVNETLASIPASISKYSKTQSYAPKFVGNMKTVFDDKDVDAVIIATPEHWHTLATIWALQAGKHVFVEKNPTLSIWEGQKMIEATKKYKKVVSVGFENRSAPYGFSARDYIKSGKLGKVVHVKCYCMLTGEKWMPKKDTQIPAGLNWNDWLGPAKRVAYNPNRHSMTGRGGWLDFWDYGGGTLSDDASHVMDLARLALDNPGHPKSVSCSGGNIGFHSQKETPEFLNIFFDYGDFAMTCESGNCTPYMSKIPQDVRYSDKFPFWPQTGTRIEIYGTERLMYLGRHGGGWQVMEKDGKVVDFGYGYFPDKYHQKDFIDSIRGNKIANGDPSQAHLSASLVHLADIAYRNGNKQLFFDGKTERFTNSESANKFLKGTYHAPFVVPEHV